MDNSSMDNSAKSYEAGLELTYPPPKEEKCWHTYTSTTEELLGKIKFRVTKCHTCEARWKTPLGEVRK